MKSVTMKISKEDYAIFEKEYATLRYFSPEDYLQGVFNTAIRGELRSWFEHYARLRHLMSRMAAKRDDEDPPEFYEDEGGGIHHIDERDDDEDEDEDIPF